MNLKSNIITAFTLFTISVAAQNVDRNVTVEREYKPIIQDAGKITSVPTVTEANAQKSAASYTDINLPIQVGQSIQTLSAAELELEKKTNPASAYIRIGAGNYYNNMLDFALPVIKRGDMRLDLKANHLASFGDKTHSTSNASLIFNNYYGKMELLAGVNAGYEYFNYYGKNFNSLGEVSDLTKLITIPTTLYKEETFKKFSREAEEVKLQHLIDAPLNDGFWRFNAYLGARSAPAKTGLRYDAVVNYNKFNTRNGLTEDIIHTKAGFNNVNGKNRMGVDVELQNMYYSSDLSKDSINVWDSYSVFSMNPYYSFERDNWNVRLGVKTSFSFIHGRPFSPSPDIFAEWKAIPTWLAFYGGVGGGYKVNTLDVSMTENRFLFSDLRIQDTYTPLSAYFGIKIKPVYNLLLDAYVSYKYIDNQYFFINKDYTATAYAPSNPEERTIYTNKFNAIYSRASLVNVGFRANYNIRNSLNVQLKGVYNGWKTFDIDEAWQKPKFEADLTSEVRISRNLNVNGSIFVKGARHAKLGDLIMNMKPVTDVNLGASYSYLNWFTIFGKVNNLLNSHYDEFYGYQVQGLNIMVGAAFSF
ncbi:MAG: hypothetical protein ACOYM7_00140 [Paludibacter sp.]